MVHIYIILHNKSDCFTSRASPSFDFLPFWFHVPGWWTWTRRARLGWLFTHATRDGDAPIFLHQKDTDAFGELLKFPF